MITKCQETAIGKKSGFGVREAWAQTPARTPGNSESAGESQSLLATFINEHNNPVYLIGMSR